jgi:hypothetical protein
MLQYRSAASFCGNEFKVENTTMRSAAAAAGRRAKRKSSSHLLSLTMGWALRVPLQVLAAKRAFHNPTVPDLGKLQGEEQQLSICPHMIEEVVTRNRYFHLSPLLPLPR